MSPWRTIGHVVAGSIITVLLSVSAIILTLVLGFVVAGVTAGGWPALPVFVFLLATCAIVGGATTGFLRDGDWTICTALGGLAAALGVTVIGVAFGLVTLVIALGMTTTRAQGTSLWETALYLMALGGGTGFAGGMVFGAVGGIGAYVTRLKFDH